jgi:hypothetical protein
MTALNRATRRRLMKLPQIPSVWEGDRRSLRPGLRLVEENWADSSDTAEGECVLWIDGSQGLVRAMDMVPEESGHESIVRTLLRAMEYPHSPGKPARPQKIVVRDREIQFYLRGVLQELEIAVEYVQELPLIEEIFQSLQESSQSRPPSLPPQYAEFVTEKAEQLWSDAPWVLLGDHQIIEIELNRWDLGKIYLSIMGMLGMEFGILMYRSLESLKQFRQRVVTSDDDSRSSMEEAFLGQDCLFLTYEGESDEMMGFSRFRMLPPSGIEIVCGSLNPLEGLRSFLYDEEALALGAILEALHRFVKMNRGKLQQGQFPPITTRCRITMTTEAGNEETIPVKVTTLPDLATELFAMVADDEAEDDLPPIHEDLIPDNAFLSLGVMPWEMVKQVRSQVKHHQPATATEKGEGLPMILVQTSQQKGKVLIDTLKAVGGLRGICFNPGSDSMTDERYDLGLLQAEDDSLFLFGEFDDSDPVHIQARQKWDKRCKNTQGYCGFVVAKGVTGASRGQPKLTDILALFEVRSISATDLNIGTLERKFALDWL